MKEAKQRKQKKYWRIEYMSDLMYFTCNQAVQPRVQIVAMETKSVQELCEKRFVLTVGPAYTHNAKFLFTTSQLL